MSDWEQIFVGNGTEKEYGNFKPIKCMIDLDKVEEFGQISKTKKNGKRVIYFDVLERKEIGEYGDTHNIVISFKADENPQAKEDPEAKEEDPDDLPF